MVSQWLESGVDAFGVEHRAGDEKLTWEVIRDSGIYSYEIGVNPTYESTLELMDAAGTAQLAIIRTCSTKHPTHSTAIHDLGMPVSLHLPYFLCSV